MKNLHKIKDSKREDSKPRHRGSLPVLPFHLSIHWGSPSRSVKSKGKSDWQKSILKRTSLQGRISQIVGNELNSANEQQGLGVAVLVLVLIISPVIIFLVRSATITIQVRGNTFLDSLSKVFSLNLARKAYELNMEKRRGDKLLFQAIFSAASKANNIFSDASTHCGPGTPAKEGCHSWDVWISHCKTFLCLYSARVLFKECSHCCTLLKTKNKK